MERKPLAETVRTLLDMSDAELQKVFDDYTDYVTKMSESGAVYMRPFVGWACDQNLN